MPGGRKSFLKEKEEKTTEEKGEGKWDFMNLPTEFWTQEELGEIVEWLKDEN